MINSQIRIPEETWEKLKKIAEKEKRSINAQLVYIVEQFINEEEQKNRR